MSDYSLMSVKEVIDSTFGEHEKNIVNFKLLQTVLYILAKQLRLLERHVEIIGVPLKPVPSVSSIKITEVKMQAPVDVNKPTKSLPKLEGEKTATDKGKTGRRVTHTKDDDAGGPSGTKKMGNRSVDSLEERHERELRIINQRADSREEPDINPKPMASVTSTTKIQQEKLFVVERTPATKSVPESVHRSIVTQEQFQELATAVKELEALLKSGNHPGFPENVQLMGDLRKGASLTDAMAALQLSARLEAAERALEKMTNMVTDLAKKIPEIPVDTGDDSDDSKDQKITDSAKPSDSGVLNKELLDEVRTPKTSPLTLSYISKDEFDEAVKVLHENIMETVTTINKRSRENAEAAIQTTKELEAKLEEALDLGDRMDELEVLVNEYATQVNSMDTELSAQMTTYQEQLTQMQYDLDAGLEAMAEAVSSAEGDPAAVAELNGKLTSIHSDIENATLAQKELEEMHKQFTLELKNIWKHFEILRETKSDRDEVEDALRDKAGLADLNSHVRKEEFDAVRGDYEKRIKATYSKFDNQELIWQKVIEDLVREINEKADWVQTAALRDEINMHIKRLNNMIQALSDVVGEPRTAAISRKLFGMGECLSCSRPAYMNFEEPNLVPQMPSFPTVPRPPIVGAENAKPQEDGDHGLCYPGQPIPHSRDPRSYFCHRFCGGAHTLVTGAERSLPGVVPKPLQRNAITGLGSDGKTYLVDDKEESKPCGPCNKQGEETIKSNHQADLMPVLSADEAASELTPSNLNETIDTMKKELPESSSNTFMMSGTFQS